eukprot:6207121-Pleurochrysis_carterae.AAC.1
MKPEKDRRFNAVATACGHSALRKGRQPHLKCGLSRTRACATVNLRGSKRQIAASSCFIRSVCTHNLDATGAWLAIWLAIFSAACTQSSSMEATSPSRRACSFPTNITVRMKPGFELSGLGNATNPLLSISS